MVKNIIIILCLVLKCYYQTDKMNYIVLFVLLMCVAIICYGRIMVNVQKAREIEYERWSAERAEREKLRDEEEEESKKDN